MKYQLTAGGKKVAARVRARCHELGFDFSKIWEEKGPQWEALLASFELPALFQETGAMPPTKGLNKDQVAKLLADELRIIVAVASVTVS